MNKGGRPVDITNNETVDLLAKEEVIVGEIYDSILLDEGVVSFF